MLNVLQKWFLKIKLCKNIKWASNFWNLHVDHFMSCSSGGQDELSVLDNADTILFTNGAAKRIASVFCVNPLAEREVVI